jgi:hypothetical protein
MVSIINKMYLLYVQTRFSFKENNFLQYEILKKITFLQGSERYQKIVSEEG